MIPQTPGVPDHAAKAAVPDALSRAVRTFAQGLVLDVLAAVALIAVEALSAQTVDWRLLGLAIGKTAAMTAASYVHRLLRPPPAP
jgi:hypothetical protein